MCGGGPIEDKRTFRTFLFLLFLMADDEFCRTLYILSLCCSVPPPPTSGILRHARSFQISDVIPYTCMISCSWRRGPSVFHISPGYVWVTEELVYRTRRSTSGFVGSNSS